ncbi:MAG TPA: tetratricopeptide repeat protein [Chitinophagaceae bacterium]|jgi:tetratricopeptide (TPR) repeat protein
MNLSPLLVLSFCSAPGELRSSLGNTIKQHVASLIKLILVSLLTFCCTILYAEKVYDFNTLCQQAYKEITSLKLSSGAQLVNEARKQNPDNLIPEILDSYIDFYILFFNEDPADYERRIAHFADRLDKLGDGPENSPFYNFCLTVVYMQKASAEIKFGRQWAAGWDFRKAFSLVKENRRAFPSFLPNNMIYGPMLVVAGTIPDGYKWLASLFGISGSIKDGINQMQQFVNSKDSLAKLFFDEASFYYCYILFYIENKPEEAFQYIQQKKLDVVNNHLLAYMAANLAINDKKTEYAKNVILQRNSSAEYLDAPVWDFEFGYIKLRHLEIAEAVQYFQNFLNRFKGKFYVKDAYEKLSWCYYLQGNMNAAEKTRQLVLTEGSETVDADKQANKNAESGVWPNPLLLKARILNDGGYNNGALVVLAGKNINDYSKPEDQLEFAYRLGRIYDDMNRDEEAIKMYLLAIKLGENRPEYYAARAALQIGYIYEERGKKDTAITYFQKCLNMNEQDYKNSLDQKAKAGIERCKEE